MNWVPYNSTQFWHFLPGDGIWFHRLKFQSYKTVPPHTHIHTSDAYQFSSVHFSSLSCVWLFVTPCPVAHQASLFITKSWSLLKLMSIELVMPSNHLILCRPLNLLPSIFPSIRSLCKWASSLYQVAKVLEFQLQHQSFQWIFRTDFL